MLTALVVALCALPAMGLQGAVVQRDAVLERALIAALVDCLALARITTKEACTLMGLDQSQWTKIQKLDGHLPSLTRLLALPWGFWQHYLPMLAWTLARKNVLEIADTARPMLKADLHNSVTERRSA